GPAPGRRGRVGVADADAVPGHLVAGGGGLAGRDRRVGRGGGLALVDRRHVPGGRGRRRGRLVVAAGHRISGGPGPRVGRPGGEHGQGHRLVRRDLAAGRLGVLGPDTVGEPRDRVPDGPGGGRRLALVRTLVPE